MNSGVFSVRKQDCVTTVTRNLLALTSTGGLAKVNGEQRPRIGRQSRERGFREKMIKCEWIVWVCAFLWLSVTPAFALVTQAQIDKLLAGQKAIVDELAPIMRRVELKTFGSRGSDTGGAAQGLNGARVSGTSGMPSFLIGCSDGGSVKSKKLLRGTVGYPIFQFHLDALLDNDPPGGPGGGV